MKEDLYNCKRKGVTMFFCDIYGTIDGGFSDGDLRKFASLLKKIKEENSSDYLLFGMLSTENSDIVDYYEKQLSKYFDSELIVMKKFPDAEALREAKISCALYYIKHVKKKYDINGIYCVDDLVILQDMFKVILKKVEGIDLNTVIPKKGQNNLKFINEEIEKRFINKNLSSNSQLER